MWIEGGMGSLRAYSTSRQPAGEPGSEDIVEVLLVWYIVSPRLDCYGGIV